MSNKPKKKSTVITIDSTLHQEFRKYCEDNGVKIGFLAAQALRKLLDEKRVTTQVTHCSSAANV